MTQREIGYDGFPPSFMPVRGSEVVDSKTGRVVREATAGTQNVNSDRLEWLRSRHKILPHQHEAGVRLQRDWEAAALVSYATLGEVGGGSASLNRPSHVKLEAGRRFANAVASLADSGRRVVVFVVLENRTVEEAARLLRLPRDGGIGALIVALDVLAAHYGLATPGLTHPRG